MRTALCLLALLAAAPASAEPTAAQILHKARQVGSLNLVGLRAQVTLTNVEKGGSQKVRQLVIQSRKLDGRTKTLSRFLSPPDVAGVALLTVAGQGGKPDEIWLYAPKVRRARRIAPEARGQSFMESEFSYADFSGGSLDAAGATREKDAQVAGQAAYVVSGKPKGSPYTKVVAYISKASSIPLKVEYFDAKGLLKTYTVQKVAKRAGRTMAVQSEMVNARTGRKSTVVVGKVGPADAAPTDFTPRGLERG